VGADLQITASTRRSSTPFAVDHPRNWSANDGYTVTSLLQQIAKAMARGTSLNGLFCHLPG
jgi:hypothetical protein